MLPSGLQGCGVQRLPGGLGRCLREQGASVVREFRVYNSRLIPRLFATTFKTAPLPKLHGVSW